MGYTTVAIILLTFIVMLAVSNLVLWRRFRELALYLAYLAKILKEVVKPKKKGGDFMIMDPKTGNIRVPTGAEAPKEGEVGFQIGEKVEVNGCLFEVMKIDGSPDNVLTLKGQPKA